MDLYVQYGCGLISPEGWMNFDASPSLRLQKIPLLGKLSPVQFPGSVRFGDIRPGLPLKDGSVKGIYCSHVLEHLALDDFRLAIRNTFKVLRPGGIFRLCMPDLRTMTKTYLANPSPDAAVTFLAYSHLGRENRPRGLKGLLRQWLGNSDHLWMWDFESLQPELANAGFVAIRRAAVGDSGDPAFAAVEDPIRWDLKESFGVHCEHP